VCNCIRPKYFGKISLEQQGSGNIENMLVFSLYYGVLLGSLYTTCLVNYSSCSTKLVKFELLTSVLMVLTMV